MKAYDAYISATSTAEELCALEGNYPEVSAAKRRTLQSVRRKLAAEEQL